MTMRRTQRRLDEGDSWEDVELRALHKGEVFRMFEDDGEPVKGPLGHTEFLAASEPYKISHATDKAGDPISEPVWSIETVPNPGF